MPKKTSAHYRLSKNNFSWKFIKQQSVFQPPTFLKITWFNPSGALTIFGLTSAPEVKPPEQNAMASFDSKLL